MSNYAPKPLRDFNLNGIFSYEDEPVQKSVPNRWQQQRDTDGSPHTRPGASALTPPLAGPALYFDDISKAQAMMVEAVGSVVARDIYAFLDCFAHDSPNKKRAIKILEDEIKIRMDMNSRDDQDIGPVSYKKLEDIQLRKKQLIIQEESRKISKGLDPEAVVKAYLAAGKDSDSEADDLEKKYEGFKKLKSKLKGKVSDPGAVAAAIGRKKYGKKKFQEHAASGEKMRGEKPKSK